MKHFFIILLLFSSFQAFSQNERKQKKTYKEPFYEKYFVLKSNAKIKDGPYVFLFKKDTLINGFYKNDKKDSIWSFFNSKGELEFKYNYNSREIVFWNIYAKTDVINWGQMLGLTMNNINYKIKYSTIQPIDSFNRNKDYTVFINKEKLIIKLDQPPLYSQGSLMLQVELSSLISKINLDWEFNSSCLIQFKIDETGNTSEYKIIVPSGKKYEETFLKLLKEKNLEWIPGKYNGNAVSCIYELIICTKTMNYEDKNVFSNLIFKEKDFFQYHENMEVDDGTIKIPWDYFNK
jgi:hypothetical protein